MVSHPRLAYHSAVSEPAVTELLVAWREGDAQALDALTPLVYSELRGIAQLLFRRERDNHTLQPTALVNEAFIKLIELDISWQDRAHFFALAARLLRRALLDHARARDAQKRGGDVALITLDDNLGDDSVDYRLLDLDRALDELTERDARKAELIEMKLFGGLQLEEIAEVTNLSVSTVQRELRFARAWLTTRLS